MAMIHEIRRRAMNAAVSISTRLRPRGGRRANIEDEGASRQLESRELMPVSVKFGASTGQDSAAIGRGSGIASLGASFSLMEPTASVAVSAMGTPKASASGEPGEYSSHEHLVLRTSEGA